MPADSRLMAEYAGSYLDLVRAPFTLPRSRLLVFRQGDGIRVHTAEYERSLEQCRVIDSLTVRDSLGETLSISRVLPQRIEFGAGVVELAFAGPGSLTLGLGSAAATMPIRIDWVLPDGSGDHVELAPGELDAIRLSVSADRVVRVRPSDTHTNDVTDCEGVWLDWFARCPQVRDDLQEMAAFCWWVLGANIVELPRYGNARAVVPSKIGYVGLWQWDAYFIAVGLRHGDPELAREQLDLAFRFPASNGQLPDVVHENGVLWSSDDLPETDRAALRRTGSAVADSDIPVPLTKPPLAAWALAKVLEVESSDTWAREQVATITRSQDWWFAHSDLDADGMPEYGHPYSSGLDDSPIFDGQLPTTAPDLGAYLILQDITLAALVEQFNGTGGESSRERARRTLALLLGDWDAQKGQFCARGAGVVMESDTIVGLMPLLTGMLPEGIVQRLVAAMDDELRFKARWSVPTVAVGDPDFSAERMWRGPVWINTNALVIEGLRASGQADRARALAEQTLALVQHAGGPHEYFNPLTGQKAELATTAFAWSAALFIDLAVGLSGP